MSGPHHRAPTRQLSWLTGASATDPTAPASRRGRTRPPRPAGSGTRSGTASWSSPSRPPPPPASRWPCSCSCGWRASKWPTTTPAPTTSRSSSTGWSPCWPPPSPSPRATRDHTVWSTPPSVSAAQRGGACSAASRRTWWASTATRTRWRGGGRLAPYADRATSCTRCTTRSPTCSPSSASAVDGILFDLGVSSMQLDVRERGFAYAQDAPLDMRMNGPDGLTAADVLNTYPAADLARILRDYGEEKFAQRIADRIVRERDKEPFTPSGRLVELLYAADPGAGAPYRGAPGQAHLPGAPHRGQRRAQRPPPRGPGRDRRDRRRRPRGGDVLPLARGPAGQAGVRGRDPQSRYRWTSVRPRGREPELPAGHPGEKATRRNQCNSRAASARLRAVERVRAGAAHDQRARCSGEPTRRGRDQHEHVDEPGPTSARIAEAAVGAAADDMHSGRGARRASPSWRCFTPRRRRRRAAVLQHLHAAGLLRRRRAAASRRSSRACRSTSTVSQPAAA